MKLRKKIFSNVKEYVDKYNSPPTVNALDNHVGK